MFWGGDRAINWYKDGILLVRSRDMVGGFDGTCPLVAETAGIGALVAETGVGALIAETVGDGPLVVETVGVGPNVDGDTLATKEGIELISSFTRSGELVSGFDGTVNVGSIVDADTVGANEGTELGSTVVRSRGMVGGFDAEGGRDGYSVGTFEGAPEGNNVGDKLELVDIEGVLEGVMIVDGRALGDVVPLWIFSFLDEKISSHGTKKYAHTPAPPSKPRTIITLNRLGFWGMIR